MHRASEFLKLKIDSFHNIYFDYGFPSASSSQISSPISLPSKIHTLFLLRKQAPKKSKSNKIKTSKPGKD